MQTVRQMASGIVYALVSLLLVIGSLSLSLSQGESAAPPSATPRTLPTGTSTRVPTTQPTPTGSGPARPSPSAVATQIIPTSTHLYPTVAATPQPTSTFARAACGPFAGWVKGYVVQPGDTLFRIAILHGTTVDALQRANCRTGTVIYAGERLWVPFVLQPPTQVTIIPTFDTPTEPATATSTPESTSTATDSQDP